MEYSNYFASDGEFGETYTSHVKHALDALDRVGFYESQFNNGMEFSFDDLALAYTALTDAKGTVEALEGLLKGGRDGGRLTDFQESMYEAIEKKYNKLDIIFGDYLRDNVPVGCSFPEDAFSGQISIHDGQLFYNPSLTD